MELGSEVLHRRLTEMWLCNLSHNGIGNIESWIEVMRVEFRHLQPPALPAFGPHALSPGALTVEELSHPKAGTNPGRRTVKGPVILGPLQTLKLTLGINACSTLQGLCARLSHFD
jgi:hypothetical protein